MEKTNKKEVLRHLKEIKERKYKARKYYLNIKNNSEMCKILEKYNNSNIDLFSEF